jgi:hypothetical protein
MTSGQRRLTGAAHAHACQSRPRTGTPQSEDDEKIRRPRTVVGLLTACRGWRVLVVPVLALGLLVLQVATAGAVVRHGPPPSRAKVRGNTEMTVTDWFPGQGVTGFIANRDNPFDPVAEGYPAENPTTGFTPKDEGFAGVIHGKPTAGCETLNLYCIDINTDTWGGIGDALGKWDASNVQNVASWRESSTSTTPTPTNPPSWPMAPRPRRIKQPPPCRRPSGSSPTATS